MRPLTDAGDRAAVVYNPVKAHVDALRAAVSAAADDAGFAAVDWYETSAADAGQGPARKALDTGARLVLAAGGDGTVRAVAEILRGTDVPLGLVPSGTGNLLARNLGLPRNGIRDSVAIAFGGRQRRIDVGIATVTARGARPTEHAFLVMAGLGLDAAIMAGTNAVLKKRVGWLAYVDAGVRSLPRAKNIRIHYRLEDEPERTARVSTILIGNCGLLPGGIELLPDARIDDGLLDVGVLQPRSLFGWMLIWRRMTLENRVLRQSALGRSYIRFLGRGRPRTVTYLRGRTIDVHVDDPHPFEIDGDGFGEVVAVQFRTDPSSLSVKVG